jgi:prolyl oligopeptidase
MENRTLRRAGWLTAGLGSIGVLLGTGCSGPAAGARPDEVRAEGDVDQDENLWLEEVLGERALAWVEEQNRESVAALEGDPGFKPLEARLLAIYDSDARIPYVERIGAHYYNFWKDARHERGLWRRTTLAEYRKSEPAWETVLDLDALSRQEGESWVWHGADCLRPTFDRCLVSLSKGGKDADVTREFDLPSRRFVEDGYQRPEAKGGQGWIDRDRVFVHTDFGPGSLTASGYPRVVKEWRRGTPLEQAVTVFEGRPEDMHVFAYHDPTPGFERDAVYRGITFYTNEVFLRRGGKLVRLEKPDDAQVRFFREFVLLHLRSDWDAGGQTYPAGALLAAELEAFLAGERKFEVLFRPGPRTSLSSYSATRGALLLNVLDEVKGRALVLRREGGAWRAEPLPGLPELGTVSASAEDAFDSDAYWVTVDDLLTPTRLLRGELPVGPGPLLPPEKLKELPAFFEAGGLRALQHQARSRDGTLIPYFVVAREDLPLDGQAPTLLYGYGGFEVPILPNYRASAGAGWLERGGVYVLANIRGGGEFGPTWHQAALRENRQRAYDDFIAVAEDLIAKKLTSPARLGILGGSNGGLLVGNMLVQRPELFGAVVCAVPLLDMRRYHKLLAGASWVAEYGDPDKPEDWAFLQRYSPYQLVRANTKVPPTFFFTSTRDDRVHPGHARKMVARLLEQGHAGILYFENTEGGHAGAATNKQSARLWAQAYTFLWQKLAAGR